jgi:undecaprenyl-diphosphatase
MTPWIALFLGIVEGLTEYLPVSSTGHLVLAGHWLGLPDEDPATSAFEIVIQLGAIMAVVAHYRTLLTERGRALVSGDPAAVRLLLALAMAFAPTAVAGLLLRKTVKKHLFGPVPVAFALIVGGIAMIAIERHLRARRPSGSGTAPGGDTGLEKVTARRALAIGLGQCVSLWPGASRAMCTIVAGQIAGLSTATAAEFSFLLALPTLGAATLYEALKSRFELAAHVGWANMAIGLAISFAVAWGVIASFLRYLRTRGLEPFGWYRVAVGVVVLWALR